MCVNGFIVALVALSTSAVSVVDCQSASSSSSSSSLFRAFFDLIEEEEEEDNILNRLLLEPVKDVDSRELFIINGNDAGIGEYPWFGKYATCVDIWLHFLSSFITT
jgi:hypothetical protein